MSSAPVRRVGSELEEPRRAGLGHNGGPAWTPTGLIPQDATAVIYRPARSAMTSGSGGRPWTLRFEPRIAPFIEPLMGWTGSEDVLAQVKIPFATREAAVAFAQRQGWQYRVEGAHEMLEVRHKED